MSGRGIGLMTNQYTTKIKRVVKYPDLALVLPKLIAGVRILDVRSDRIQFVYSIWSVAQNALTAELSSWILCFDHKMKRLVNLPEEDGVYQALHASLIERAAESRHTLEEWEKRQAQNAEDKIAKV
ncbi:hypothetical protein N7478_005936 [Penicillium angulare]|uniref:uncharacterized protein n=1 Tax=Penicillium angulare TaxID=116970 RepID=UPI0025422C17|nr:uncharacterized protein N7478_005936 [Penicillium angulare]KAJ5280564.1 hypothetical protein N7478_005936 [Penicillium angulare]